MTEHLELPPETVQRLESSPWPWDKCTLCAHMDCEHCEMLTEEAEHLEQEFFTWQWWMDAVKRLQQCRHDKAETIFTWTSGYAEAWTLEVHL